MFVCAKCHCEDQWKHMVVPHRNRSPSLKIGESRASAEKKIVFDCLDKGELMEEGRKDLPDCPVELCESRQIPGDSNQLEDRFDEWAKVNSLSKVKQLDNWFNCFRLNTCS